MIGLGRLGFAVAAAAALCGLSAGPCAWAAPKAAISGDLTPTLRNAIASAVGDTDRPIANRFEARRRAREAAEDAISVLRSEGYYAYDVDPDVGDGDTPAPVVKITPGPRFTIADPDIAWVGQAPLPQVQQAGEAIMGLADGQAGRAADVIGAEGRILAAVQKRGYADAAPEPREVIVDHADRTVRPTFRIAAGDLVRLDSIHLVSPGRTDPAWLKRMSPWKVGDVYDPDDVGELERRLLDTGVYDSVTVALAPKEQTTADGLRPIVVSISDRKPRTIEAGASYSTSEGTGAEVRWTRYNILGRADTFSILARGSTLDSRLQLEATLPHWRRPQQTLKATFAPYKMQTDAYDSTGVGGSVDIERRFYKTSFLTVGGSMDYSRTDEKQAGTLTPLGRNLLTTAALAAISLDRSDDVLDPKRGYRVEMRMEPTVIAGEGVLPYLKLQTQGSIYVPFGPTAHTVLAARMKLGTMLGASESSVPASRRFFAGGGGSVRGYAYQAIGPRLSDNTPQGGISLGEASLELRQKLTTHWGVVAFLDGGAVGTELFPAGKDFSAGAGIGVRYDLGFGPIRADIAIPLDKREGDAAFQIYLSIGQSF
jgi:translocation and assembly module TamA